MASAFNTNNNNNGSALPPRYPQSSVEYGNDEKHDYPSTKDYKKFLEEDQAEQGLLESVESRRGKQPTQNNKSKTNSEWQPAVEGERPPFPDVPFQALYSAWNEADTTKSTIPPPPPPGAASNNLNRHRSNTSSITMDPSTLKSVAGETASRTSNQTKSGGGSASRGSRSRSSLLSRGLGSRSTGTQPNYAEIAHKMRRMNSISGGDWEANITPPMSSKVAHSTITTMTGSHRRHPSRARALLDAIQEKPLSNDFVSFSSGGKLDDPSSSARRVGIFEGIGTPGAPTDVGASSLAMEDSNTDQLITGAMQVERLFRNEGDPMDEHEAAIAEEEEAELYPEVNECSSVILEPFDGDPRNLPGVVEETLEENDETQPLTTGLYSYGTPSNTSDSDPNGRIGNIKRGAIAEDRREALKQRRQAVGRWKLWKRRVKGCFGDPRYLLDLFYHLVVSSLSFKASAPLTLFAAIFFYQLGDPSPEFLPGQASISWWLLFLARQCFTLDLARVSQWIIIDGIILSSRTAVRLLGPLCTLVAIQSKGWPFCGFAWAVLDLFILHGKNKFQQHWLYWTGVALYEYGNTGLYLLDCPVYTRILLASMVAGMATTGKRTIVALYFGRRTFVEFKPRLEKILREVIVLSEVAELAMEAEILEASVNNVAGQVQSDRDRCQMRTQGSGIMSATVHWSPALNTVGKRVDEVDDEDDDEDSDADDNASDDDASIGANQFSASGSHDILYLLEQWDEPKNVMDKTSNTSINDILKFRRALSFMDDAQPFGGAFGPAHNRDAVVRSSEYVFRRLLTLSTESETLPFEALEMLAHEGDVDGPLDRGKLKTIKRMFRPDKDKQLSLIDFVKACDGLYKKLRFFRASVGNASVIDHHLESIIDSVFYFVLVLVLLSVTGLNPWPLLVSISTLLVSISFAVGSSASKYIEGILLIAVRRPYDLGDRIYMMDPSVINSDLGIMVSWFIEDINLFNTTVRYAATNETGTINNGSIANMRIVNGNRSQNAVVWFQLPFRTKILRDGRMDALRAMLEQYAQDHPKQWHSYSYCRIDKVHAENDKLVVTVGFQHRSSWQDLAGILNAKSELMCHVLEYGKKNELNYEDLPTRQLMYYAGRLKQGGYKEHRDSLHEPENIVNDQEDDVGIGLRRRTKQASLASTHTDANEMFLSQVKRSHCD